METQTTQQREFHPFTKLDAEIAVQLQKFNRAIKLLRQNGMEDMAKYLEEKRP